MSNNVWTGPNDIATFQRYATVYNQQAARAHLYFQESNAMIVDASFIRLRHLSLAYLFPKKWTSAIQCKLYVQGQNIFTLTKYKGPDPETGRSDVLPVLRTLVAGVNLVF